VVVLALLAGALAVGDRLGFFGRTESGFEHLPEPSSSEDRRKYDGKTFLCVRVVDGDTLDIEPRDYNRPHTRIRLWGVDTPETVKPETPPQHYGPEASRFVKQLCQDEQLRLELDPKRPNRGNHKRLLAYVYLPDGRMLNRELVRLGYAYADPRFQHRYMREFMQLQAQARQAGRGLWQNVRKSDLPYYYRDRLEPGR
jgi:micrococcal nuclease